MTFKGHDVQSDLQSRVMMVRLMFKEGKMMVRLMYRVGYDDQADFQRRVCTRVRRIRLKNLFALKRIEANLDLIPLIFACFIFFANLIYSLHSLIFA
jgi:hypothetical protein